MLSVFKPANFRSLRCLTGLVQNSSTVPCVTASVAQPTCTKTSVRHTSGSGPPNSHTLDHRITLPDNRLNQFSTSPSLQLSEDEEDNSKAITERISSQLDNGEVGRLFAVVYISGNQRKITAEDIIVLDHHIEADIGETITLNKVLLVGSKDFSLVGRPVLGPDLVRVEATVLEKTLSYTRVRFRYLRRQNNRKMRLRKERYTYLRINSIDISTSLDTQEQYTPTQS